MEVVDNSSASVHCPPPMFCCPVSLVQRPVLLVRTICKNSCSLWIKESANDRNMYQFQSEKLSMLILRSQSHRNRTLHCTVRLSLRCTTRTISCLFICITMIKWKIIKIKSIFISDWAVAASCSLGFSLDSFSLAFSFPHDYHFCHFNFISFVLVHSVVELTAGVAVAERKSR